MELLLAFTKKEAQDPGASYLGGPFTFLSSSMAREPVNTFCHLE